MCMCDMYMAVSPAAWKVSRNWTCQTHKLTRKVEKDLGPDGIGF